MTCCIFPSHARLLETFFDCRTHLRKFFGVIARYRRRQIENARGNCVNRPCAARSNRLSCVLGIGCHLRQCKACRVNLHAAEVQNAYAFVKPALQFVIRFGQSLNHDVQERLLLRFNVVLQSLNLFGGETLGFLRARVVDGEILMSSSKAEPIVDDDDWACAEEFCADVFAFAEFFACVAYCAKPCDTLEILLTSMFKASLN